jgi:hypothetical protein
MKAIKDSVKKLIKIDPFSGVTPLKNMVFVGSKPHG